MKNILLLVFFGALMVGCSAKEMESLNRSLDGLNNSLSSSNQSYQYQNQIQVNTNSFGGDTQSNTYRIRPLGNGYYRVQEK